MFLLYGLLFINPDLINDTGFSSQFMIKNDGYLNGIEGEDLNVINSWKLGYSGKNIHINVVDSGCRLSHVDFNEKTISSNSFNLDLNNSEVFVSENSSKIGTHILSISSAQINNKASVGIAPNSNVSCNVFNMNKDIVFSDLNKVIQNGYKNIDIKVIPFLVNHQNRYIESFDLISVYGDLATQGRDGKGVIIINSAGNTGHLGGDSSSYGLTCSRFAITVGSTTNRGFPTYYTNFGSCISISAPSSGLNDNFNEEISNIPNLITSSNFDDELITVSIGNTVSSTAAIAGVVALLLESNPNLTYRDVQLILQLTATKVDPNSELWIKNANNNYFHPRLGFGRANSELAITISKNWINLPESTVSSVSHSLPEGMIIPDVDDELYLLYLNVDDEVKYIEYIEIELETLKSNIDHMRIFLKSPSGTEVPLVFPNQKSSDYIVNTNKLNDQYILIGSRAFLGENPKGEWIIKIGYTIPNDHDCISYIAINVYGPQENPIIPSINKQIANDPNYKDSNNSKTNIYLNDTNLYCDKEYELFLDGVSPYDSNNIPLYLIDKNSNNFYPIKIVNWINNKTTFKLPCIFKSNNNMNLSLRLDQFSFSVSVSINYINNYSNSLISPNKSIININELNNNSLNIKWNKQNIIKPIGYLSNVIITIYDINNNKILYFKNELDKGETNILLNSSIICKKCSLSITPLYEKNFDFINNSLTTLFELKYDSPITSTITTTTTSTLTITSKTSPSSSTNNNSTYKIISKYLIFGIPSIFIIVIIFIFIFKNKSIDENSLSLNESLLN